MNVGQSKVTASVTVGQAFMIESQAMHDRCLQIVRVDGVFDHMEAKIVRFAILKASLGTAPCHPHGIGLRVVISAVRST
jgi:uncharacterized protein YwbE